MFAIQVWASLIYSIWESRLQISRMLFIWVRFWFGFCPLISKIASIRQLFFDLRELKTVFSEFFPFSTNLFVFYRPWKFKWNNILENMNSTHQSDLAVANGDYPWYEQMFRHPLTVLDWIFSLRLQSSPVDLWEMRNQNQKSVQHGLAHRRCTECM